MLDRENKSVDFCRLLYVTHNVRPNTGKQKTITLLLVHIILRAALCAYLKSQMSYSHYLLICLTYHWWIHEAHMRIIDL